MIRVLGNVLLRCGFGRIHTIFVDDLLAHPFLTGSFAIVHRITIGRTLLTKRLRLNLIVVNVSHTFLRVQM